MTDYFLAKLNYLKSMILNCCTVEELLHIENRLDQKNEYSNQIAAKELIAQYQQAAALLKDIKAYTTANDIDNCATSIFKVLESPYNELIYYTCSFKDRNLNSLRDINIFGLYGKYCCSGRPDSECFIIEAGVKLSCKDTPLELKRIHAGNNKRVRRGTLGLKFLEEYVVPEVNDILYENSHFEKIGYIYGISADLSPDTDSLARAKFYSKNGFSLTHSHFYKYIK